MKTKTRNKTPVKKMAIPNGIISLLLWVLITMSPAAMQAFGDICGAEIKSGTMELFDNGAMIEAKGEKNGISVHITCRWKNGRPSWIKFRAQGSWI